MDLTVCVHTEVIPDRRAYASLLHFVRGAHELGLRVVVCAMTPRCPAIARMMEAHGVSEEVYGERLSTLAEVAHIGFHGHMLHPRNDQREPGPPGAGENYWGLVQDEWRPATIEDGPDAVRAQFTAELAWLRERGFSIPFYTAGWWWLPPVVTDLLQAEGLRYDLSVKVFDPRDTFGNAHRSLPDLKHSKGRFFLDQAGTVEEIPSIAGILDWTMKVPSYVLRARLRSVTRGAFYLHDYDLPGHETTALRNLRLFSMMPGVHWLDLPAVV